MDQFIAPTLTPPAAEPKARKDIANIFFLLDKSGSMGSILEQAISGFNQYIESQRGLGPTFVTLVQFDDVREVSYENLPLEQVEPLTTKTYVPRGSTALNDSIGYVLSEHLATCNPEHTNIMAIFTDGAENASREYKLADVKELIARAEGAGWEVLFLGANMKAETVVRSYGISASNVSAFEATAKGTADAFSTMSVGTTAYRGLKSAGMLGERVDMQGIYTSMSAEPQGAARWEGDPAAVVDKVLKASKAKDVPKGEAKP